MLYIKGMWCVLSQLIEVQDSFENLKIRDVKDCALNKLYHCI